jgi:uncharacterized protein YjbI with pentapeptide repeats
MDTPSQFQVFTDTGETSREKENFQNYLFKDIDYRNKPVAVSFRRSDFRAVKMQNMHFFKNNFDRADFVNAYLKETTFDECNFGTDFFNTVFEKCTFKGNNFDTSTLNNNRYFDCCFENEHILNTTNRQAFYSNCTFKNCIYEMNSFEDINFDNCIFENINFAEMGAYNFSFTSCSFKNFTVDPDYLGSYLFKHSPLEQTQFMYRGDGLALNNNLIEDLKTLSIFYLQSSRLFEAFNMTLLYRQYSKQELSILGYLDNILDQIGTDKHDLRKFDQINRIIKAIIFYANSTVISIEETFYIIGQFENKRISFDNMHDQLQYVNNIYFLKQNIESILFETGDLSHVNPLSEIYCEITIEESSYEEFKTMMSEYLNSISSNYGIPELNNYKILGTRKGSLIVEIIGYATGIYVLITILKSIFVRTLEIKVEYTIYKKTHQLLEENNRKLKDLETDVNIARRILSTPSDEILTKARPLSLLMKNFSVFPNALVKGKKHI